MMAAPATFADHVQRIVDDFLHTVVVVDDQAFDGWSSKSDAGDEQPQTGAPLGRDVTPDLTPPNHAGEHDLDPKAITDAFAETGLICSLLSPRPGEPIDEMVIRITRRADLIVLDWVLNRDEGKKTLGLLSAILEDDEQAPRRRLRTIAVYTGQKDLPGVARQVRKALDPVYSDCPLTTQDGGLSMTKGPVRIAVFAKEAVENLPKNLQPRQLSAKELAARLRKEFATLTSGLISTVALAAITALRDDTHRILTTLNPKLDPAYLGHRSVLPDPEDAEAQAVDLVVAEISSVIAGNNVGRNVDLSVLKLWLAEAKGRPKLFGELIENKTIPVPQVERMLEHGIGTDEGAEKVGDQTVSKKHLKAKVRLSATSVFSSSKAAAERSNSEFFHRMTMRTAYAEPPRTLQLGTILVGDKNQYRLCVQPVCDSVRLDRPRLFPFLKLTVVGKDKPAKYVVRHQSGTGWVRLTLGSFPRDIEMISFDPRPKRQVTAQAALDTHTFVAQDGTPWRWAGELKADFAQQVAVDLAQRFARVGVDEPELLRLSRPVER
jgi:hypothetical protein